MNVGAHVSTAGGITAAVERQIAAGGSCGQLFTGSPVVWEPSSMDADDRADFRRQSATAAIDPWVIHAPYLVNLATPDEDLWQRSIERLQTDVDRAAALDIPFVNVHLGAHTGSGVETGLEAVTTALSRIEYPDGVQLLVETDPGTGTKLGGRFEELEAVLAATDSKIGVCFDTAHVHVAGYDLSTPADMLDTMQRFDEIVGLDTIELVHLNDPVHAAGSRRDEHAHIGSGTIGTAGVRAFLETVADLHVPLVLETPVDDDRGNAWNVEQVKELAPIPTTRRRRQ